MPTIPVPGVVLGDRLPIIDAVKAMPNLARRMPGAQPAPPAVQTAVLAPSPKAAPLKYVVMPGDTLSKIAKQFGTSWQQIASANQLGSPDVIHAGQTLMIPRLGENVATQEPEPVPDVPPQETPQRSTGTRSPRARPGLAALFAETESTPVATAPTKETSPVAPIAAAPPAPITPDQAVTLPPLPAPPMPPPIQAAPPPPPPPTEFKPFPPPSAPRVVPGTPPQPPTPSQTVRMPPPPLDLESIKPAKQAQTAPSPARPAIPTPGPRLPPPPRFPDFSAAPITELEWDWRLDALGVGLEHAQVESGNEYWRLVRAVYQAPDESSDSHQIQYSLIDELGQPVAYHKVWQGWPNDKADALTNERGETSIPLWNSYAPDRGESGAYYAWVDGLPTDRVYGMGLPLKRHVSFLLTWQRTAK
jgi:LysM repeat protein